MAYDTPENSYLAYLFADIRYYLYYNARHGDRTLHFFITNFSVDFASIPAKSLRDILYSPFEGNMSQNLDLGPGYLHS